MGSLCRPGVCSGAPSGSRCGFLGEMGCDDYRWSVVGRKEKARREEIKLGVSAGGTLMGSVIHEVKMRILML